MSLNGASGEDPAPLAGSDPLLQSGAFIAAFIAASTTEEQTPEPAKAQSNGWAGRAKSKGSDPVDWVPDGWRVEYKVRTSGATAGTTDRYYHDPVSGHRFRSKKEVLHFLETGTPKKHNHANSDKTNVESSASKKQKKSSTKPGPGVNFDFFYVPEKVEWVLTDTSQWTWTPYMGDQKVPESTAKEWATAFTVFTSSTAATLNETQI